MRENMRLSECNFYVGMSQKFADGFNRLFVGWQNGGRCRMSGYMIGQVLLSNSVMTCRSYYYLLDSDAEVGIFDFGGGEISICLHQFLITRVYFHADLINGYVDFLRFNILSEEQLFLHSIVVREQLSCS